MTVGKVACHKSNQTSCQLLSRSGKCKNVRIRQNREDYVIFYFDCFHKCLIFMQQPGVCAAWVLPVMATFL